MECFLESWIFTRSIWLWKIGKTPTFPLKLRSLLVTIWGISAYFHLLALIEVSARVPYCRCYKTTEKVLKAWRKKKKVFYNGKCYYMGILGLKGFSDTLNNQHAHVTILRALLSVIQKLSYIYICQSFTYGIIWPFRFCIWQKSS